MNANLPGSEQLQIKYTIYINLLQGKDETTVQHTWKKISYLYKTYIDMSNKELYNKARTNVIPAEKEETYVFYTGKAGEEHKKIEGSPLQRTDGDPGI